MAIITENQLWSEAPTPSRGALNPASGYRVPLAAYYMGGADAARLRLVVFDASGLQIYREDATSNNWTAGNRTFLEWFATLSNVTAAMVAAAAGCMIARVRVSADTNNVFFNTSALLSTPIDPTSGPTLQVPNVASSTAQIALAFANWGYVPTEWGTIPGVT